jgi:hypothetical protein
MSFFRQVSLLKTMLKSHSEYKFCHNFNADATLHNAISRYFMRIAEKKLNSGFSTAKWLPQKNVIFRQVDATISNLLNMVFCHF